MSRGYLKYQELKKKGPPATEWWCQPSITAGTVVFCATSTNGQTLAQWVQDVEILERLEDLVNITLEAFND